MWHVVLMIVVQNHKEPICMPYNWYCGNQILYLRWISFVQRINVTCLEISATKLPPINFMRHQWPYQEEKMLMNMHKSCANPKIKWKHGLNLFFDIWWHSVAMHPWSFIRFPDSIEYLLLQFTTNFLHLWQQKWCLT